ncbi:MAG: GNAT superfamily N-acetyltransferase [Myxococcota bacterium]|jgi:GNAT superfamily N-acetyltransferase
MNSSEYEVRTALDSDIESLPAIEVAAAQVVPVEDLGPSLRNEGMSVRAFAEASESGRLLVAASRQDARPVGFAMMLIVDGQAHLHELDVEPSHARKGLGAALVKEAARWAQSRGLRAVTLTTFRHLAFNAPFYARYGFRELAPGEIGSELEAMLKDEEAHGLDRSKRLAMELAIEPQP